MISLVDVEAPIVPGVGLGGFKLGCNIGAYEDLLRGAFGEDMVFQLWSFQASYAFPPVFELDEEEAQAWLDEMDAWQAKRAEGHDAPLPTRPHDGAQGPVAVEAMVDVAKARS